MLKCNKHSVNIDVLKKYLLKEWIMSIEEINPLKTENEKLRLEKSAEDDVANLSFQHDKLLNKTKSKSRKKLRFMIKEIVPNKYLFKGLQFSKISICIL